MILKTDNNEANELIQNQLSSMINCHAECLCFPPSITGDILQNTAMGKFIRCSYGGSGDMVKRLENVVANIENSTSSGSNNPNQFNTYPFGNSCSDIFPQLVVLYREKEGEDALKKDVAHMVSYCQKAITSTDTTDEREIILFTDIWKESMQPLLETQLAPFYFTGKLCVHVILFTPYGLTCVPFFMERKWSGPNASLMYNWRHKKVLNMVHELALCPIEFSYCYYDGTITSPSRDYSYEIFINFDASGEVRNSKTGKTFHIPTEAVIDFATYMGSIRDNLSDIGGSMGCDCPMYYIKVYHTSISSVAHSGNSAFEELVDAFKQLLRSSGVRRL